jgi:murein DD-endopeptidase MepM/ murein hydrolase activator NlpD
MKQYKVQKKDTLWKIARDNRTTVDEIGALNGLKGRQLHMLKIDQILNIPDTEETSIDTNLSLQFCALDFSPITPKSIKVFYDGKEEEHCLVDKQPLNLAIYDHSQGLRICIFNPAKEMEEVLHLDQLPIGQWKLSVDSRMVKGDGSVQPKKGVPASEKKVVRETVTHNAALTRGATQHQQTRAEGGEPIHAIGTIYIEKNLRLSKGNERYRKYIIAAAEKYGHTPQSLAAMINAEAISVNGAWNEKTNISNNQSAKGLTQFLPAAWTTVFEDQQSLLYKECKSLTTDQRLNKRYEAKYAIDGLASYASSNIRNFEKRTGLTVSSLPPDEKAKVAYLLHHEGVDGVMRLINLADQLSLSRTSAKLLGQLGRKNVAKFNSVMRQYDMNPRLAYEGWLYSYTDSKIIVSHFLVDNVSDPKSKPKGSAAILKGLAPSVNLPKPKPKPRVEEKPSIVEPKMPQASVANESSGWRDPLDVCTLRTEGLASKLGATFGKVRQNRTKNHQGIDLAATPGTPIYAVADGTVHPVKAPSKDYAYGNTLILVVNIDDLPPLQAKEFRKANPDLKITTIGFFYAHLDEIPERVRPVNCGEVIGRTGSTGNAIKMKTIATGAHLHFEVRKLALAPSGKGLGNRTDPLPFIMNCTNR